MIEKNVIEYEYYGYSTYAWIIIIFANELIITVSKSKYDKKMQLLITQHSIREL